MKFTVIPAFSALFAQQLLASSVHQSKKEASSFLENESKSGTQVSRSKRGLLDTMDITGEFVTMAAWENFKDSIEELDLPEAEVDRLESCVFQCRWKDHALDFVGKAYEEKRETWYEYKSTMGAGNGPSSSAPRPCPHCCKVLPVTMFGQPEDRFQKLKVFEKLGRICMPKRFPNKQQSIGQREIGL